MSDRELIVRRDLLLGSLIVGSLCFGFSRPSFAESTISLHEGEVRQYQPATVEQPTISLIETVQLALRNDPNIHLQNETSLIRKGQHQVESGRFDPSVIVGADGEYLQNELSPARLQQQKDLREQARELLETFQTEREEIADRLAGRRERLPEGIAGIIDTLIANENDPAVQNELIGLKEQAEAQAQITLQEIIKDFDELIEDQSTRIEELGSTPHAEIKSGANIDIAYRYPFRNGIVVQPGFDLSYSANQFRGKEQEQAPIYRSLWSFTLDVPLGRGSGLAARAGEDASELVYKASLLSLKQSVSNSIFNALNAYWTLVSAQERAQILRASANLQAKLAELSRIQIESDLIPSAEMDRIRAREANVKSSWIQAERQVQTARFALARQIGLSVESLDQAPRAGDQFPPLKDAVNLDTISPRSFIDYSVEHRHDYKAAQILQNSELVRVKAADINLARQSDVQIELGYSGIRQDAEVGEGIRSAAFGNLVGASVRAKYQLDWEVENNGALGRLASSDAIWKQRGIFARDQRRNIKNNVLFAFNSLRETKQEVGRGTGSTQYYLTTMSSELEKYKVGSSTLIGIILTEERSTDAQLQLVNSRERYAKFVNQLRFETATLFQEDENNQVIINEELTTIPSLAHAR